MSNDVREFPTDNKRWAKPVLETVRSIKPSSYRQ